MRQPEEGEGAAPRRDSYDSGREEALRRELASIRGSRLWEGRDDVVAVPRSVSPPPRTARFGKRARASPSPPSAGSCLPASPGRGSTLSLIVVLRLPSIGWNIALVQRPQHLAREFVKQGFLVVYDGTGKRHGHLRRLPGGREEPPHLQRPAAVLEALENPLLWTFPYNAALVDQWPRRRVLYDFIDDLDVFPYDKDELARSHAKMLREAEQVFCVSKKLLEKTRLARPDAVYLPNAVEAERFESLAGPEPPLPEFLEFTGRFGQVAGYYGAIASWMDVERRPGRRAGGPTGDSSSSGSSWPMPPPEAARSPRERPPPRRTALRATSGVPGRVHGRVHPLQGERGDRGDLAAQALRVAFSGGKPVISTPMPECAAYPEVTIVRDAAEFSAALDKAARDGGEPRVRRPRQGHRRENSWGSPRRDGAAPDRDRGGARLSFAQSSAFPEPGAGEKGGDVNVDA